MKLYSLIKKDFILAKDNLVIVFLLACGIPIFINRQLDNINSSFISFFIMVLYSQYILYNKISLTEDKFKGASYLTATPYTRELLVKSRYLFIFIVFLMCCIIYTAVSIFSILPRLNNLTLSMSLLVLTSFFSVILPLQYKFGYEKTKFIIWSIVFFSPFAIPTILNQLSKLNINLEFSFNEPILYLLSVIIGYVSMKISINIYYKKDL